MASKSKRNKVKFKWTKELSFLIAFVAIIGAVALTLVLVKKFSGRDIKEVNEDYSIFDYLYCLKLYDILMEKYF